MSEGTQVVCSARRGWGLACCAFCREYSDPIRTEGGGHSFGYLSLPCLRVGTSELPLESGPVSPAQFSGNLGLWAFANGKRHALSVSPFTNRATEATIPAANHAEIHPDPNLRNQQPYRRLFPERMIWRSW